MRRLALSLLAAAGAGLAQQNRTLETSGEIEIVQVREHLYLLAGAGGNIAVSVGSDGVLLADTGAASQSDKVIAAIHKLNRDLSAAGQPRATSKPVKPIRYIANTSSHPDHTGGNLKLAQAGRTFTGGNVAGDLGDVAEGAAILAHEETLQHLTRADVPSKALPTETYFGNVMKLSHFFNGEGVVLYHIPNAVTDGDSIVHFRGADVIASGDIFVMGSYPPIDVAKGGSVQGVIAGLNKMLDIMVPEFRSEGGTFVIPGHGRISDTADVAYYRDMVTIIRDRVQDMIKKGMTLDQVKRAKPTEDWDPRFGSTAGPYTTDMFVEAVYRSLSQPPQKK
jgi:glyoxylase-like metal-dependent hydrolase (beta-lactamase superfamily II)